MNKFSYLVTWIVRLGMAVTFSFGLFTGVSLLHAAFGLGSNSGTVSRIRRIETVDILSKPKEQGKPVMQRVRRMHSSATREPTGGGKFDMRFSPDLTIDVGNSNENGVSIQQHELAAEVYDEGQVDQQAVPQYSPPIPYPEKANALGISGVVEVEFIVNYQGAVSDLRIIRTPSQLFVNDVRKGVAQWRFIPARKNGIPVNQRYRRSIEFILQ